MVVRAETEGDSFSVTTALWGALQERLKPKLGEKKVELMGCCPSPRPKLKGLYRHFILVKCAGVDEVREEVKSAIADIKKQRRDVKFDIELDVDPIDIM